NLRLASLRRRFPRPPRRRPFRPTRRNRLPRFSSRSTNRPHRPILLPRLEPPPLTQKVRVKPSNLPHPTLHHSSFIILTFPTLPHIPNASSAEKNRTA